MAKLVNVAVSEAVGVQSLRVRVSLRAHQWMLVGFWNKIKSPGGEIGRRTTLRG